MSTTIKAVIGSLATNAITLAIAFGASISVTQQIAILTFVGSLTTAATSIIAWHEKHKLGARVALATTNVTPAVAAQVLSGK